MSSKPSLPFHTTPGGGLGGRGAGGTLNSDTSRPSEKPKSGRVAVKVINHLRLTGSRIQESRRLKQNREVPLLAKQVSCWRVSLPLPRLLWAHLIREMNF